MLYDFLFDLFDSFPAWSFFLYFLLLYLCLHLVVYQLLLLSAKFSQSDYSRRSYILCAVLEAGLLSFIRYVSFIERTISFKKHSWFL